MTPKEKANEIANKMYRGDVFSKTKEEHLKECDKAKKHALICVDELLKECTIYNPSQTPRFDYWQEVKQEIEKL